VWLDCDLLLQEGEKKLALFSGEPASRVFDHLRGR
jgi:hypothetical protein